MELLNNLQRDLQHRFDQFHVLLFNDYNAEAFLRIIPVQCDKTLVLFPLVEIIVRIHQEENFQISLITFKREELLEFWWSISPTIFWLLARPPLSLRYLWTRSCWRVFIYADNVYCNATTKTLNLWALSKMLIDWEKPKLMAWKVNKINLSQTFSLHCKVYWERFSLCTIQLHYLIKLSRLWHKNSWTPPFPQLRKIKGIPPTWTVLQAVSYWSLGLVKILEEIVYLWRISKNVQSVLK